MKSESRIFNLVAVFLFFAAGVYAWWTWYDGAEGGDDRTVPGLDWVGTVALILCGILLAMCGLYFGFVARRIEPRPEDRPDAEVSDGAGELGFFSPGSYWPFGLAAATALAGIGIVFWYPWLIGTGMIAVIGATGGLLFEYYTGTRRSAHH